MKLALWPVLYFETFWKPSATSHHEPQKWKARRDFRRFDAALVHTECIRLIGEPKRRMPWRIWIYWKDGTGKIWARHWDWMWFQRRVFCK